MTIEQAKSLMGRNIIGPEELEKLSWIRNDVIMNAVNVPFAAEEVQEKKNDYLLIYGISRLFDGKELSIRNLCNIFGKDSEKSEPCFYNQDWYEREAFIDNQMREGWFFIRKNPYEDSRAVLPDVLMEKYIFPSAITCTYAFFVSWLCLDEKLWYHDFVWCSDRDHNGDRIYVGKYHDIDAINKNGFSIHRHLALRPCYGCID